MTHRAVLVSAKAVESAVESLPFGTSIVICDPDGALAAEVARRVTSHRTCVFVGDISDVDQRAQAAAMCREIFGVDPED